MWKKGAQGEILCHHCTGPGGEVGGAAGSGATGGTGGRSSGGGLGAATFASPSAAPPQSNGSRGGKQKSIFYKGVYYQIGDLVSVIDEQDGKPYYAQIRGFIQDQYCDKSAALTWLIPTLSSPRDQFDPASYIIGPEEDLPRKMEYLVFVCHAPSEHFKSRSSPFPTVPTRPEKGYIWTHVGPTPAITIKETVANHL
ncbi:GATA zinc finger domain-containing protein 1 [Saguinus oedipus]|uniref:GATA zinc finger domain-containing protein 1 n=1 Tax=Saguinus oedipus TaxID=9490 RepID=A0ABQ9TTQ0_SAGOE|nr:GATA zinc finger domain-containing protein 1 [Saguinus oedipus]